MDALWRGAPSLSGLPPGTPFEGVCGRVSDALPSLPAPLEGYDSRNNRFVQRALEDIEDALAAARARWSAPRIGICVGSSTAAMDEIERAYAEYVRGHELDSGFELFARGSADGLVQVLRELTHIDGPAAVLSNACASSGKAFASAKRWLEADLVDAVLVGGADSLCQTTLRGFRALGLLSDEPTRPFSKERNGINIGEGAAFALLERAGEGPRLLGSGESSDAYHMTSPDPEGRGARRAMEASLVDAGMSPAEVDHVNAHGTGTRSNDVTEAKAIRDALGGGSDAIVVSTKGYVGHTLGAAGAIEAVFALEEGRVPASVGAAPLDPELGLRVATECCEADLRLAISNSLAFGGSNVSLVFGAPE
jgi:3-oxoacyl-[acyl-carrier-protein] synthase-1